jgi:hypothetical protein
MTTTPLRTVLIGMLLSIPAGMLLAGCAAQRSRAQTGPASRPASPPKPASSIVPAGQIDSASLREDLRSFESAFQALVENASDSITEHTTDPQIQRVCVLWRNRVTAQVRDSISSSDPAAALLEVWVICLRMRDYLVTGGGATFFGSDQPKAVEAGRQALSAIEDVAAKHLSASQRKAVRLEIQKYASQYPYTGSFDNSEPAPLRLNISLVAGLKGIIGVPLAPLVTAGNLNQGVNTIKDWAPTVDRLTDVMEDYPRSVRWQTDRFLLDLNEAPSFKLTIQSVNRISDSADELSRTVSDFRPIANRYAELMQTLPTDTANQVQSVLAALDRNQTAQSATQSLDRISASSEQLIIAAQQLPSSLQKALDNSSQTAGVQGKDLVDHIAWRAAELLAFAFLLAAILILLSRLVRRRTAT